MTTLLFANLASTTLNSPITNVAVSLTLAPGSGSLFPSPGAGQGFLIDLKDAATGLLNEIVLCTARSGDVCTVARAQEGTAALSWLAGDIAANLLTAGTAAAFMQQVQNRIRLQGNTDFYVATTGNDSTGTGLIGAPWATAQHASNIIQSNYDLNGFIATVHVADGTYTGSLQVFGAYVGAPGSVQFLGNAATPAACIFNTTATCFEGNNGAQFSLSGFTTISATTHGVNALSGSQIKINGLMNYGACSAAHIAALQPGSLVSVTANYSITGSATNHLLTTAGSGMIVIGSGVTGTCSGTPAFTNFARCARSSTISAAAATYTGAATGQRYLVDLNGVIDTAGGGANFFPGNSPGAPATGGQYA